MSSGPSMIPAALSSLNRTLTSPSAWRARSLWYLVVSRGVLNIIKCSASRNQNPQPEPSTRNKVISRAAASVGSSGCVGLMGLIELIGFIGFTGVQSHTVLLSQLQRDVGLLDCEPSNGEARGALAFRGSWGCGDLGVPEPKTP